MNINVHKNEQDHFRPRLSNLQTLFPLKKKHNMKPPTNLILMIRVFLPHETFKNTH